MKHGVELNISFSNTVHEKEKVILVFNELLIDNLID